MKVALLIMTLSIISGFSHATTVTPLLKTQTSWDGSPIQYPSGKAEITAIKISLNKGEGVPYHCHPVPTFGYILKGAITVTKPNGETTTFKEGDAVAEVMALQHAGHALNGATELLVFYAGSVGVKNTHKAGSPDCLK